MSRIKGYFIGIFGIILISTAVQTYFCCEDSFLFFNSQKLENKIDVVETNDIPDFQENITPEFTPEQLDSIRLWEGIKSEINANPLLLYFDTGQTNIYLTGEDRRKFLKIIEYSNSVVGSKIVITGHSDNVVGTRNTNEGHSLERAKFARDYFVKKGIPIDKIELYGKGELEPIADNETEEGRAKNRRAEITVK